MRKLVFLVVGLMFVLAAGSALAYNQYSQNGGDLTNCGLCHGDFRANSYISPSDGQNWGTTLHDLHRTIMLGGDCNTCHGSGPQFPVVLNQSAGGNGLSPLACVGCHGRAEDDTAGNPDFGVFSGYGAGLRQHHQNAGVGICSGCHQDADPANYTPVGEDVLPDYYANPGTNHPNIPPDSCNPAGVEDFAGITEGLDNDGDGVYDLADTDCELLSVAPSPLVFGSVTTGTASSPQTVTITNGFRADIHLSTISLSGADQGDFSLDVNGGASPCGATPVTLAAAAGCTVSVTFTPGTDGAKSASLDINSNGGTPSVNLSGTGTTGAAPGISVTPPSLGFGTITTGTSSAPQTVIINSTGTADLTVSDISLSGADAGDFSLDVNGGASPCGSAAPVIAAGNNCTVSVTFSPGTDGTKSAALDITSDGGNPSVGLSGTGSPAAAPGISVTPPSLDFGAITTGTSSAPQTVTIDNTGTAALTVGTITISGADAGEFSLDTGDGTAGTCGAPPVTLAQGEICTVSVTFSPGTDGARSASLDVTSDGGSASVGLSGTGQAAAGNTAPTAPALVAPGNGSTVAGPDVTLGWNRSTDPDGDTVTYDLFLCEGDEAFGAPCDIPVFTTPIASASTEGRGSSLAGLAGTGMGLLFVGIALSGGLSRRRKLALLLAVLLMAGMFIAACGGDDHKTPPPAPTGELTFDALGLNNGVTYYWQVVASDGTDSTPSPVWSFNTQ